ncbi:hypothetical protein [Actinotignum schaalii]|nr:hypothetical protein [Actinotignum schaalii]
MPLPKEGQKPNAESLLAIYEIEEMIVTGSGESYSTARDLLEAAQA